MHLRAAMTQRRARPKRKEKGARFHSAVVQELTDPRRFNADVSITCFYYMSLRTVIDPSLVGLTRIVVCCGRVKKRRSALA